MVSSSAFVFFSPYLEDVCLSVRLRAFKMSTCSQLKVSVSCVWLLQAVRH